MVANVLALITAVSMFIAAFFLFAIWHRDNDEFALLAGLAAALASAAQIGLLVIA